MPNLEVSKKDLELLFGKKFSSREDLEESLEYVKGEIDSLEGDALKIDCKETNRPDLWSAEGIARDLKARMGNERGIKEYTVQRSKVDVFVSENLEKVRPLIACAVVKDVKITEDLLKQMIQLQEKVGENYGRKRKELGIGLYDFDIMKPPVYYKGFKDNEIEFIPLEWKVPMRPSEILAQHEKGKQYKHLLEGSHLFPIVIDSNKTVASMPPIINSQTTGKVTEKTRNLFIEVTGFKWETVETALEVICMCLADRGGKIFSCRTHFPAAKKPYPARTLYTPVFATEKMSFDKELVNKITGLGLKDKEIIDLLGRARYNASIKGSKLTVEYSTYRTDILQAVDIIEDLLISYGFNNIAPQKIEMNVLGSQLREAEYNDFVREGAVGIALQEVMTYNLSSKLVQGANMQMSSDNFVEIANPISTNYEILRKRLAPQLLDFFSKNKGQAFPQRIFEIGTCLTLDDKAEQGVRQSTNICVALTHSNVNFTEAKSFLTTLCKYLGAELIVKKKSFPFLGENSAEITVNGKKGFLGEIKPEVIEAFGLRKPVALFEFEL
ncbi:Phenylalanine--tRNA ligase beta subunit [uncultured archaeon]|nr:Phenylalanine--tRNA ligase beta subunit [uncultured archaeon]